MASKEKHILALLLFCVLAFGVLYSLRLGNELRYYDEKVYLRLASNLASSFRYTDDGRSPAIYRPPGYPFILAGFIRLGGNIFILRFVNFIALSLSIYLVWRILRDRSSRLAAMMGALMVVFYPVLLYTSGTLYPQTIAAAMFLYCLYVWGKERASVRLLVFSGLLFGLLILIVPTFTFVIGFVIFLKPLYNKTMNRRRIAAIIMLTVAIVGLWIIRNYVVFHSFAFVATNSSDMLMMGNTENATPYTGPSVNVQKYRDYAIKHRLNEIERGKYYKKTAVSWIMANKSEAAILYVKKLANYFNYRVILATHEEESNTRDMLMLVTYGPLLALFAVRLFSRKYHFTEFDSSFSMMYFASAIVSAVFFTRIRYRIPFDYLLIMVVAKFVSDLVGEPGFHPVGHSSTRTMNSDRKVIIWKVF